MAKARSRYSALIEKIFFDHYQKGESAFEFDRNEIKAAAQSLGLDLPDNIGDVIYSFRFRKPLPEKIIETQPKEMEWVIELAGTARYRFKLVNINRISPVRISSL